MFDLSVLRVLERLLWAGLALFREGLLREGLCNQTGSGEEKDLVGKPAIRGYKHCPFLLQSRKVLGKKNQHRKQLSRGPASSPDTALE